MRMSCQLVSLSCISDPEYRSVGGIFYTPCLVPGRTSCLTEEDMLLGTRCHFAVLVGGHHCIVSAHKKGLVGALIYAGSNQCSHSQRFMVGPNIFSTCQIGRRRCKQSTQQALLARIVETVVRNGAATYAYKSSRHGSEVKRGLPQHMGGKGRVRCSCIQLCQKKLSSQVGLLPGQAFWRRLDIAVSVKP